MVNGGREIASVRKAVHVLNCFSAEKGELGISEIAALLGEGKSTVHAIVKTLENAGYLRQNPENKKHSLGLKLIERAHVLLDQLEIREIARPYLTDLAQRHRENVHLGILENGEVVYIDKVEMAPSLAIRSYVGHRTSAHSTAMGKVLLAFASREVVDDVVQRVGLPQHTPNTITDLSALRAQLDEIRACGYAIDNQEHQVGGLCIGAPIFEFAGRVIAALSISVPLARMDEDRLRAVTADTVRIANGISARLGHVAP